MLTVEQVCNTALQLAGMGDKASSDDLATALRTLMVVLNDWAAVKDVHFWNLSEQTQTIGIGDRVTGTDSAVYQCIVAHTAAANNCPITGAYYADYWKASAQTTGTAAWVSGTDYTTTKKIEIADLYLEDALALRLGYSGQFSPIQKITAMEYAALAPDELGEPSHAWVEKTSTGLAVHLWPNNDLSNATLFYYAVRRPDDLAATDIFPLADQWGQALYYAVAVELGFIYNISIERLKVLGLKARDEFNKAFQTNESEPDECFVKPCY